MISGSIRKLYLLLDSVWVPVGCLTANGFSESNDVFETTVRSNGGFRSIVPALTSYSVSFDGIVVNSIGDSTRISLDRLRTLMRSKALVNWKLEADDDSMLDFGYGYIIELGDSANVGEFITFNGVIQGTGEFYNIENDVQLSPPSAPFISFTVIGERYLEIEWEIPDSEFPIEFFNIYKDDVFYSQISFSVKRSGLPQNFIDRGIEPESAYAYNVSAVNINGTEGPLSNKIIAGFGTGGNDIPDGGFDWIVQESYAGSGRPDKAEVITTENYSLLYQEQN